jgi:hypothetical protein
VGTVRIRWNDEMPVAYTAMKNSLFGVDSCCKGFHRPTHSKHQFKVFLNTACTLLDRFWACPFVIVLAYALPVEDVECKAAHGAVFILLIGSILISTMFTVLVA